MDNLCKISDSKIKINQTEGATTQKSLQKQKRKLGASSERLTFSKFGSRILGYFTRINKNLNKTLSKNTKWQIKIALTTPRFTLIYFTFCFFFRFQQRKN